MEGVLFICHLDLLMRAEREWEREEERRERERERGSEGEEEKRQAGIEGRAMEGTHWTDCH